MKIELTEEQQRKIVVKYLRILARRARDEMPGKPEKADRIAKSVKGLFYTASWIESLA